MKKRYQLAKRLVITLAQTPKLTPALALRQALADGYRRRDLVADLMAGAIVGMVALPLSMALAIASGVPPQHGIYTAIIAGAAVALLGGSRVNVTGPTAAFVVILEPIAARYGIGGLLVATTMAGGILIAMGAARMGRLIEFIPYPVTTGFTAGIATVIATLQIKDILGVKPEKTEHFIDGLQALGHVVPDARWSDLSIGLGTLALLIVWPRISKRIPGPLVALAAGAVAAALLAHFVDGFSARTIASSFGGIPQLPPTPVLPWTIPDANGHTLTISYDLVRTLAPSAFAIAMLGAIESLLCAVVADGMAGTKHDPDAELVALGTGNVLAPFFGGIAATGAIARTATNVRSGARSPLAAFFHAMFILAAVLGLAPVLGYLPMASLGALLLIVAWNMSELKHFLHITRVAPKSDVIVLLTCYSLTVLIDMVWAVSIGVVLAALLFMRRMAEIASTTLVGDDSSTSESGAHRLGSLLPKGTRVYEIAGPLFFGAAQKAMSALEQVAGQNILILHIGQVPVMDVTGLVALESSIARLQRDNVFVIVAGVQAQPRALFEKADLHDQEGKLAICATLDEGIRIARAHTEKQAAATGPRGLGTPSPT